MEEKKIGRDQFTFYRSFWEAARALPKKDRLAFLEAVCAFAFEDEAETPSGAAAAAFLLVKPILNTANRKAKGGKVGTENDKLLSDRAQNTRKITARYEEDNGKTSPRCREDNGKIAARCDEDNGKMPPRYAEDNANNIEIEKEIEIEIEVEKDIENETEIEKEDKSLISDSVSDETEFAAPTAGVQLPLADFVKQWNSLGLTQITRLAHGTTRYKLLKARIGEYGYDAVSRAVEKIRASDFLMGRTDKPFNVTLDWFLKPNNFPKVLDGNYDNTRRSEHGGNPFLALLDEEVSHDTR